MSLSTLPSALKSRSPPPGGVSRNKASLDAKDYSTKGSPPPGGVSRNIFEAPGGELVRIAPARGRE